ncbi:MAG TPA: tetratricopeptide repeat protein [Candidatus Binatia bacterium]|nr:tetratricopeptide repeat protein [Candidatus Binatia bacterium]
MSPSRLFRLSPLRLFCFVVATFLWAFAGRANDLSATFDAANRLYEQGKYSEAAVAYERLIQSGERSETLYFNLGDAFFKAGQLGRAIAAWRQGELLAPRDPGLRFNLQFARKRISGSDPAVSAAWQRALTALTLNEWTVLTSIALWIWFLLLALREVGPTLRQALSGYTATAGAAAFILAACIASAANLQLNSTTAVVTVPEAIARSGPFEEAKVLRQLRDGVELTVLDQFDLTNGGEKQTWLQVRDTANQTGWLKGDQVAVLRALRDPTAHAGVSGQ